MMTQTWAILLDAYRELNAKKMFWLVMILNVLGIGVFALLGVRGNALSFLWYTPFGEALGPFVYKWAFSNFVVGFWFTWVATILALISTGGIFPDLMSSGSIDMYLAKPIGRLRLFLTKYATGLLFVALQVAVFSTLSFFVLGIRGGIWQPGIFWSIPLVVVFFSYLYGICVLLGVWTRSTIAALLLTILVWGCFSLVNYVDTQIESVVFFMQVEHDSLDRQITHMDQQIAAATQESDQTKLELRRKDLIDQRERAIPPEAAKTAANVFFYVKSFIPKTKDTMNILDRVLFSDEELKGAVDLNIDEIADSAEAQAAATEKSGETAPAPSRSTRGFRAGRAGGGAGLALGLTVGREHSEFWIIGTSLAFEAVVVALAAWSFCRRDY